MLTSDNVFLSCSAASTCPVRAVPVFASEAEGGFECACARNFFGENCRFKGKFFELLCRIHLVFLNSYS